MDSEEFESWMVFFQHRKGTRTPDNVIEDLLAARALSTFINANRTSGWAASTREMMLWPPETTAEDMRDRIETAKRKLKGYLAAVVGRRKNGERR